MMMMMMMMMMMTIRSNSNVQGQISEHIFKVKWRLLRFTKILPILRWGILSHINAFRPIICELKYLIDYNTFEPVANLIHLISSWLKYPINICDLFILL